MKTYSLFWMLLACVILGCSSSDDTELENPGETETGADADYTVLVSASGTLSGVLLNANKDVITLNPGSSPFGSTLNPEQTYIDARHFTFYKETSSCSGEITKHNFEDDSTEVVTIFTNSDPCDILVKAVAHSMQDVYAAYQVLSASKDERFFVRLATIGSDDDREDIALDKEPLQLVQSGNHLFILTFNEDDGKNALVVLDTDSNELIHEINLDVDVEKIAKNSEGNIIVSYPELHLEINGSTMGVISTIRYDDGKEPKFGSSKTAHFDILGNLYYQWTTDSSSEYPTVPAVYDFGSNTAILYFYENFLTPEQRQFQFEIGDTSTVAFDAKNNLILIGYSKSGSSGQGGLLRIKPIPDPEFVDNIDLPGVPYTIFVK
ncbi:hypothetical protein [Spongiimicrobium sp. 3-5]|uniref:hypothetical protein n=1 Tax=Spongiimicrobium sp. 3-5 TaxID=3332596 RepID=UPI003980906A